MATATLDKPDENKHVPICLTREECKAAMDDAMKDQVEYTNPIIVKWDGTYVDDRLKELKIYEGPG